MAQNKPFRKQVKDFFNGAGVVSLGIAGLGAVATYNGADGQGAIGLGVLGALTCFGIASTIKPRLITQTNVAVGASQKKKWEW
ncbi:hypothetical protein [Roseibium aggregatum]|uniref:hypothetical protein n=1 Tax=Roseibium aggregatum TaxID=187304 RepID=UPI0025AD7276|nr:hypothetical protein [Roseibium aggregatum]WJS05574.1 hypothetical protein QUB73_26920 [Roseibium aggregatum]